MREALSSPAGSRIELAKLLPRLLLSSLSPVIACLLTFRISEAVGLLLLWELWAYLTPLLSPPFPLKKTLWEGTKTRVQVLMRSPVRWRWWCSFSARQGEAQIPEPDLKLAVGLVLRMCTQGRWAGLGNSVSGRGALKYKHPCWAYVSQNL